MEGPSATGDAVVTPEVQASESPPLGMLDRAKRALFRNGSDDEFASPEARWWELVGYAALLVTALAMRLWDLGARAMHHDESLHALYSWNLFDGRGYEHSPMMHGPFQFEANAAIFLALGDSDLTARLLYAFAGTLLIAMPFLFRRHLGRFGALMVAGLLTASPAILYFSRFARNDILMAVWTLGLVISMWRYLDEGRPRYLYFSAGLLALALTTKETAYLVMAMLGLYLAMQVALPVIARSLKPIEIEGASPPVAIGRVIRALWGAYADGVDLSKLSRPAAFLAVMITLTLPQWSAFVSLFQDTPLLSWTGLVLAAGEGNPTIGAPIGGGQVLAFLIVVSLLGVSIAVGYRWCWAVWWRCAVVFYAIWIPLYTTFFTNLGGIQSGLWQSLGYWIVQQGEGRGGQPWYYYIVIGSVYEFLPLLIGAAAMVYYLRKRDRFGLFLVYWPAITFVLYTVASEKMPWLLVNITLPFIILVGKFMADVFGELDWRRLRNSEVWLVAAGVAVFMVLLWQLALYEAGSVDLTDVALVAALIVVLVAMVASGWLLMRRIERQYFRAAVLVGVAGVLLVLTVRTGWIASYRNSDIPVEMIVYTQTSPDIARLLDTIEETGIGIDNPADIDQTSGFTWPWAWYFRDSDNANFPTYNENSFGTPPTSPLVVVHSQNREAADAGLGDAFTEGERIRHRWWFPEGTYRNLTPVKVLRGILDRNAWRSTTDYWLYRSGVEARIGSEDAYVYFDADFEQNFTTP
ncbi:MAG: TIGR03663 family protein [SAR202 cluster bacterium]|nr:TIGR03663 family protein [SAR202 cluster bacterium]